VYVVLLHPTWTEQRAADHGPNQSNRNQHHQRAPDRVIVTPHTFSPLS
jgi:hypothetical protein